MIDSEDGNLGVLSLGDALRLAADRGLDLIEIGPNATPPIAKLMDFGKFQYEQNKKQKKAKAGAKATETKSIQVKIGTGDHDLELKAKQASKWLSEGHRIRVELYLKGRAKYMDKKFLEERLQRVLHLITEPHKIAESFRASPKGYGMVVERDKNNK